MNSIRQIQELNKRELEAGVSPQASWHTDYRDTAYIYIGGLPFELSEGDIITIFSQYGEPTYINLIRDKETGKSKGFAFLKYEDQRSTDLAVDNLGGTNVMGRMLRVDHTRYKRKEGEAETGMEIGIAGKENVGGDGEGRKRRIVSGSGSESDEEVQRPMIKEERELARLIEEHDEDDPMKEFLVKEKREEVALALARVKDGNKGDKERKHKHRHRHRSSKREDEDGADSEARHSRHRRRERDEEERRRSRSREYRPDGEDRFERGQSRRDRREEGLEDAHRSEQRRQRDSSGRNQDRERRGERRPRRDGRSRRES